MDADVVIEKGGEYPTYGADNGRKLIEYMNVPYDDQLWDELLDQLTWDETVDLLSNGRHKTQAIQSVSKPATGDENGPNGYNTRYSEASGGSKYSGPTNPYADRIDDPDLGAGYSTTGFSSNGILAATFNKELSYDIGKQIGEEGFWAGMAGWLGTGLNIQRSPYAGRTSEYYSEDAMLSGLIAAPEVEAMQSMGMNCFIKHCALNESETARHGACEWISEQALRENYLRAFEIAIVDGGSYSVMTAFNRMGVIAVANCVEFSQGWLRQEVGLPGIIETDCAGDMTDGAHGEAYVSRICNVYTGATDLNEYNYATDAPDYTGGTHTYADFAPDENGEGDYGNLGQAMREAAHRILWTTVRTAAMSGMSSNTDIVRIAPPWKIGIIAADIALGVLLACSVAWMAVDQAIAFKKKQSV